MSLYAHSLWVGIVALFAMMSDGESRVYAVFFFVVIDRGNCKLVHGMRMWYFV